TPLMGTIACPGLLHRRDDLPAMPGAHADPPGGHPPRRDRSPPSRRTRSPTTLTPPSTTTLPRPTPYQAELHRARSRHPCARRSPTRKPSRTRRPPSNPRPLLVGLSEAILRNPHITATAGLPPTGRLDTSPLLPFPDETS